MLCNRLNLLIKFQFSNAIANKLANGKSSAVGGATSTNQVIDLTLLKRNALYSSVSYCPPEQIQNWSCIRCQGQPAIQGTNTTSVLTSPKSIDVQGFVAVNPSQKLIIVSFRGSVSPQNFGKWIKFSMYIIHLRFTYSFTHFCRTGYFWCIDPTTAFTALSK